MQEIKDIVEKIKPLIKPNKIEIIDGTVHFSYHLDLKTNILIFLISWLFIPGSVLLAVFEAIYFAYDGWELGWMLVPMIHLGLLALPWYYIKDLPPLKILFNKKKIVLHKIHLYKENKVIPIETYKIQKLEYKPYTIKGIQRSEIRVVLRDEIIPFTRLCEVSNETGKKIATYLLGIVKEYKK